MSYYKNEFNKRGFDTMWTFLQMRRGQKANIPQLENSIQDLIKMMTQKSGGKNNKDINLEENFDMTIITIVCESVSLYLSGNLDRLKRMEVYMEVKQLDERLIQLANSNSFNGNRGDLSAQAYKAYADEILGWNISDVKKQKILDKLYTRCSEILKLEAQHVSVMVAGPANYNSKRLDKSDQILQKNHEFCKWFDDLREQIKNSSRDTQERKLKLALDEVQTFINLGIEPTKEIMYIATIDNKKFIELFEKYKDKYKWRKNSNIYKMYEASLKGEITEIKPEIFYEDENLTAYIEGDRAYIKFTMRIQRQLIVALKSRKWWWNTHKQAWSTYLNRVDKEWISTISERYSQYL